MDKLKRTETLPYPIKVLQFGEGNFLRAFVDWMIDLLNEKAGFAGGVAVIQPLPQGLVHLLDQQGGLYHHVRQGIENGKQVDEVRLIKCISKTVNPFNDPHSYFKLACGPEVKLIFSNTTEAGIAYEAEDLPGAGQLAATFPGKLTQLLKHRYDHFQGNPQKGVAIVPCELIEQNGTHLKSCILKYIDLWKLGEGFKSWIEKSCSFANTLVDRIVPGYPKEEIENLTQRIGLEDQLIVKSEAFHLFVIQGNKELKSIFPADKIGLNVKFVDDITPYRTQKVRILNGAHTSMVPIGLLKGLKTVKETIENEETGTIIQEIIFDEIVPTIQIPGEDPRDFADEIISRFKNPFIRHELLSIALNSISKFKVRVLPTILDYIKLKDELPKRLIYAMTCLIKFYTEAEDSLRDDPSYLSFFKEVKSLPPDILIEKVLSNESFWGQNLTKIEGLTKTIHNNFVSMSADHLKEALPNA